MVQELAVASCIRCVVEKFHGVIPCAEYFRDSVSIVVRGGGVLRAEVFRSALTTAV